MDAKYGESVAPLLKALVYNGWHVADVTVDRAGGHWVAGERDDWKVTMHAAEGLTDECTWGREDSFVRVRTVEELIEVISCGDTARMLKWNLREADHKTVEPSEYLDRACPALAMLPITLVQPGMVIYGWERDGNFSRKGWSLEPEPITVDDKGLQVHETIYQINNRVIPKDQCTYVLVPEESEDGGLAQAIEDAFARFENTLAFAAPELTSFHVGNLREEVLGIITLEQA